MMHLTRERTEAENLAMLESLQVIIYQTLLRDRDGDRAPVPIREYAVFDAACKQHLRQYPSWVWPNVVSDLLLAGKIPGMTQFQDADRAVAAGLMSSATRKDLIGNPSRYEEYSLKHILAVSRILPNKTADRTAGAEG